jgi:hypothetical protein
MNNILKYYLLIPFVFTCSGFLSAQSNDAVKSRKPSENSNGLNLTKTPRNELRVVDPRGAMERQKNIEKLDQAEKELQVFTESDGKVSPYESVLFNRLKIAKENIR